MKPRIARLAGAAVVLLFLLIKPSTARTQPLPPTPEAQGLQLVRLYYSDRRELNELARRYEPWEVHPDLGYAVAAIDLAGQAELAALGLRVVHDPQLDARLLQSPAADPDQASGIPGFACYRTLEETFTAAAGLAQARPDLAAWVDIGDSWEMTAGLGSGADLFVLRLTNSAVPGPKPKVFLMSGIHARELAPVELLTRFAEWLVNNYNSDPDANLLLDHSEIHLLLNANPDGRRQVETELSLWRKNTNQAYCAPTSPNRGADLNRNFDFEWGNWSGSSGNPCDEVYRGPVAASEPEVQAIQGYLQSQYADQRAPALNAAAPEDTQGVFIDVHSYGRLVLWPWGFRSQPAPNAAGLQTLGRKMAYYNNYDPGQAYTLYPVDGASDDFAYGDLGLAAFTVELGDDFFDSCSTFETEIFPQNLNMLRYAARIARTPYQLPSGPDTKSLQVDPVLPWTMTATLQATFNDTLSSGGSEPSQPIANAEYWLDNPPWVNLPAAPTGLLTPDDGIWDEPVESAAASIDITTLEPGFHRIYVRAQDSSGAWGPVSEAFLTPGIPLFLPLSFHP